VRVVAVRVSEMQIFRGDAQVRGRDRAEDAAAAGELDRAGQSAHLGDLQRLRHSGGAIALRPADQMRGHPPSLRQSHDVVQHRSEIRRAM